MKVILIQEQILYWGSFSQIFAKIILASNRSEEAIKIND